MNTLIHGSSPTNGDNCVLAEYHSFILGGAAAFRQTLAPREKKQKKNSLLVHLNEASLVAQQGCQRRGLRPHKSSPLRCFNTGLRSAWTPAYSKCFKPAGWSQQNYTISIMLRGNVEVTKLYASHSLHLKSLFKKITDLTTRHNLDGAQLTQRMCFTHAEKQLLNW